MAPTPSDLVIHDLTAADHPQWAQLYAGYREFYRLTPDPAVVERVWSWLLDPTHELRGYVCCDAAGSELLGLAHFRRFSRPSTGSVGLWLDDLFTDPSARRRGVGSALVDRLAAEAAAQGCSVLRWITAEDNATARSLYDRKAARTDWVTYDLTPEQPDRPEHS